jgi:hypothetical protein
MSKYCRSKKGEAVIRLPTSFAAFPNMDKDRMRTEDTEEVYR